MGYKPYELGAGAAQAYVTNHILPGIKVAENALRVLESPEGPEKLYFERYDTEARRLIRRPHTGIPDTVALTRQEADEFERALPSWEKGRYSWERQIRSAITQIQSELEFWRREEARMEQLIVAWEPRPLRTVEQEIERQEKSRAERDAAKTAARDAKIQAEVVKIRKRIDAAVRNRNARTLADIYSSTKLRDLSGWRLTDEQALSLLERDHVWYAFGLVGPDGYLTGEAAQEALAAMRYGRRVPSSTPGIRFDYAPLPWPPELGGGLRETC